PVAGLPAQERRQPDPDRPRTGASASHAAVPHGAPEDQRRRAMRLKEMSMSTQTHFTLDLQGIAHDFKVLAFHGREAISQPYRFVLELVSDCTELDLIMLQPHPAFLPYNTSSNGLPGLISQIAQGDFGSRLTR